MEDENQTWSPIELELARTIIQSAGRMVARIALLSDQRKPIAWYTDAFFNAIAEELKSAGISNPVAADMMGMSERTFRRTMQRADARQIGASLWWKVRDSFTGGSMTIEALLADHPSRPSELVSAIFHDLKNSGLLVPDRIGWRLRQKDEWTDEQLTDYVAARLLRRLSIDELENETGVGVERLHAIAQSLKTDDGCAFAPSTLLSIMSVTIEKITGGFYGNLLGKLEVDGRRSTVAAMTFDGTNPEHLSRVERLKQAYDDAKLAYRDGVQEVSARGRTSGDTTYLCIQAEHIGSSWLDTY